ncbi:T9SS type A sorting domain-containing protein [Lacinutrix neustonica]|uniref:T9SS type A sorting domain-containing protein n=1 Tax=Lacinutrix neustonica TaxID=2980107 RepID=A0A9E8SCU7_9FLAO|nr:T9SS type A sorting domain-containing protein [Lacinutrix neustonica]WAC01386.1 T9SS type A sorting domain-containing protein [Lacinutrix neustonica]
MKYNKSLLFLSMLFLLGSYIINAQEAIVSSGGDASGSNGSSSFSFGQTFYTTTVGGSGSLSEGVQQPIEIETLSNPDFKEVQLKMSTYPNPTTNLLTLSIETLDQDDLSFEMYDLLGKTILKRAITNATNTIDMSTFVSGTYLLAVKRRNETLKTYKIIKK